jgi:hypothetical protein
MNEIMTKLIYNCETGEEQIIPLTEEEINQREQDLRDAKEKMDLESLKREQLALLVESAKSKLVAGQPLTEDEASAVLGNMNNGV